MVLSVSLFYVFLLSVDCQEPDLALIKSHFESKEISALWKRMQDARGKADMTIREAWKVLCDLPAGAKNHQKQVALWDFIVDPTVSFFMFLLEMQSFQIKLISETYSILPFFSPPPPLSYILTTHRG